MTVHLLVLVPFTAALALTAILRPNLALLLPLALHPLYLVRTSLGPLPTTALEILVVLAVGTAVIRSPSALGEAVRALPRSVVVLALLFLVAATLSASIAPHPRTAWGQWKAVVIEPTLYAVILLPLLRSPEGRRSVARALLAGGVLAASLSLVVGLLALAPSPLRPAPATGDFLRLRGIYDVPNSLALVLAPLTVLALHLSLDRVATPLRRLARLSLALFTPVLLLTQSFAGILAAGVISCWILLRSARRLVWVPLVILTLAFGLLAATGRLAHARAANSAIAARLQIWWVSGALIRDHPVLGVGLGTFEPAYQAKLHDLLARPASRRPALSTSLPVEWVVRDPHNLVLSFWLNTGLLGLLTMGGLVSLALRGFRGRSSGTAVPPDDRELRLQAGTRAALIALLLFGLVDTPYWKNDLALLWWVLLVISLARPPRVQARRAE